MRIAYLTDQLYLHGGVEKVVTQKLNYLINNSEFEVILITSGQKNNTFIYDLSEEIKHYDLGVNYCNSLSFFHPKNLIKSVIHLSKLRKILNDKEINVVISVSLTPDQYFIPFLKRDVLKIKEFHLSGVNYSEPKGLIQKFKNQLFSLFRKYEFVVVLNEDELKYYPFNNVVVIPNSFKGRNGFELNNYQNRDNVIIAAGRIAPVKQFDHLIKAWKIIVDEFKEWEVHIYGEGDDELLKQLKQLISRNDIPNVYLKKSTDNLREKMEKASVYALTSATECFPMVLLESLSCGLPIIAYDCPHGPKNIIIKNEDGLLVKHNSISKFSEELKELLLNSELRKKMSLSGLRNVQRFEEEVIMKEWIKLFNINKDDFN